MDMVSFRAQLSAAPLKRPTRCQPGCIVSRIPRSIERGPVEAFLQNNQHVIAGNPFRAQLSAAPLKLT